MVQTILAAIKEHTADGIYHAIRGLIEAGDLAPGAALPPIRQLAGGIGVNPNTLATAYRKLAAAGLTEALGRAGTRVAGRPLAFGGGLLALAHDARDLASGSPDPAFLPDPSLFHRHLRPTPRSYGQPMYDAALVAWGADWFAGDGHPPGSVLIVGGAMDGMERALAVHLRLGDTVAVEEPCFPGTLNLLRQMGLHAVGVEMDRDGMRPESLERALAQGCKALIWTPRAHNPTGIDTGSARAAELAAVLADWPEPLLIEDDHYALLSQAPSLSLISPERPRWLVLRSLSKGFGPDLRLALGLADPITAQRLQLRQSVGARWVSHLLQTLALGLLQDDSIRQVLTGAAAHYEKQRRQLIAALAQQELVGHGATGLNVWLPIDNDEALAQALASRGWLVRSGSNFRVGRPLTALRITSAVMQDDEIERFVSDLAECLRGGRTSLA
ncbi:aminotransferase class I/II-fold pyridoxal phosphate-dependent enzyme [Chitinimonas lacunae]|uniref:Putative 8-amino-7-oxononanoate synthase n=1 Tax=Chitinimonas lacunae TaxID=1963018 RepID=A0ABV8MPA6_9NEIS